MDTCGLKARYMLSQRVGTHCSQFIVSVARRSGSTPLLCNVFGKPAGFREVTSSLIPAVRVAGNQMKLPISGLPDISISPACGVFLVMRKRTSTQVGRIESKLQPFHGTGLGSRMKCPLNCAIEYCKCENSSLLIVSKLTLLQVVIRIVCWPSVLAEGIFLSRDLFLALGIIVFGGSVAWCSVRRIPGQ